MSASSSCSRTPRGSQMNQTHTGNCRNRLKPFLESVTQQQTSLLSSLTLEQPPCVAHKVPGWYQATAWQSSLPTMKVATTRSIFLLRSSGSQETAPVSSSLEGRVAKCFCGGIFCTPIQTKVISLFISLFATLKGSKTMRFPRTKTPWISS